MVKIALFQPDIALNVGAIIRLCACMGVKLDVIEPCGFPWNAKKIRQSAMDYYDFVNVKRYKDWTDFKEKADGRIVLMTTKTDTAYTDFEFQAGDILLAGSESAGVPDYVHEQADAHITIPMKNEMRSLNLATATAMILGEAVRQTSVIANR